MAIAGAVKRHLTFMIIYLQSAFILFVSFFLTGCKQECRVVKSTYANGSNEVVFLYPDCNDKSYYKRQGFYSNGQIEYEGFCKNGQKTGHFKSWSETGHQTADWTIVNGKEHGYIKCWYDDGTKKRESILNQGITDGFTKEWYESGEPASAGNYTNGKKTGKWKTWEENGAWKTLEYRNGVLWGETTEHLIDSTETILVAGQYEAGKESGVWKWFDRDSILYETCTYQKGKLKGETIEYHRNGKIKSKGYLIDGKYNDTVYYFNHIGTLTKKQFYKNGKLIISN
ncbi:hypothetical protein KYK31_00190 [Hymenobacter norwichensis]|nr:hypothetical protein [Hymenobacter norwichensis]